MLSESATPSPLSRRTFSVVLMTSKREIENLMDEHDCDGMYREVWEMVNMRTKAERKSAFLWWLKCNLGVE